MRVRPTNGREDADNVVCAVLLADDRCPVFRPRPRRSPSTSVGSELNGSSSRSSFMFVQALDETQGNTHAFTRTTKDMLTALLEVCGYLGAASGAGGTETLSYTETHNTLKYAEPDGEDQHFSEIIQVCLPLVLI